MTAGTPARLHRRRGILVIGEPRSSAPPGRCHRHHRPWRSSAPEDPARYAFEQALHDLAEGDSPAGYRAATWLGYSMGGRLALARASRLERVSALILESATAGIQDEHERHQRAEADQELARRLRKPESRRSSASGAAPDLGGTLPPGRGSAPAGASSAASRAVGLANSLRGMGQGAQPSYWERLGDIAVPSC